MAETMLVIIESPLKGYYERNRAYARACMLDSLKRGEAPFAGHLLYAQEGILDDTDPPQREMGIAAHLAWTGVAGLVAVYCDLGISDGMARGIERAKERGTHFTCRYGVWDQAEIERWAELERKRLQALSGCVFCGGAHMGAMCPNYL